MLRFTADGKATPLSAKQGKPIVFPTELEATKECLKHVLSYMNGHQMRGETFEGGAYTKAALARKQAENLFRED